MANNKKIVNKNFGGGGGGIGQIWGPATQLILVGWEWLAAKRIFNMKVFTMHLSQNSFLNIMCVFVILCKTSHIYVNIRGLFPTKKIAMKTMTKRQIYIYFKYEINSHYNKKTRNITVEECMSKIIFLKIESHITVKYMINQDNYWQGFNILSM